MSSNLAQEQNYPLPSVSAAPEVVDHQQAQATLGVPALVNVAVPRSTERVRRTRRPRKPTITDGPFAETKEMLGGYQPPGSVRR